MDLEDFVERKKEECEKLIEGCFPEWMEGEKVDRWKVKGRRHFDEIEAVGKEFLVWYNLSQGLYWRGLEYVNSLTKTEGEDYFSEEDKKKLTGVMMGQIIKGETVASKAPLYSDAWRQVGKEDCVLGEFVTDETLDVVVNSGFWHLMEMAGSGDAVEQDAAGQELTKFFNYGRFFNFFDFEEGAERVKHLSPVLNLSGFGNWYGYMTWYRVLEQEIYERVEVEERDEVIGKLLAPLVDFLIDQASKEYEHAEELRGLVNLYVDSRIINTEPMQVMLGRVFEKQLYLALTDSEYFYEGALKICERALGETEGLAAKVWGELDSFMMERLENIPSVAKRYIPTSYYEDYVRGLREGIKGMKRFDRGLFSKWMNLRPGGEVTKAVHNKVRNEVYQVYFDQKRRPSKDDLFHLSWKVEGGMTDKMEAYLFADFLLRKEWMKANDILMKYRELQLYRGKKFMKGLQEYVGKHGLIEVREEGLQRRTCLPNYNFLPDFKKGKDSLFKE